MRSSRKRLLIDTIVFVVIAVCVGGIYFLDHNYPKVLEIVLVGSASLILIGGVSRLIGDLIFHKLEFDKNKEDEKTKK